MKKILFLLLFTIASYGQAVFDEGIQLTNTESTTATKVNVQEANGKVNTKTINTAFNKNFGLNTGDVVGANTLLNQYSTTPVDWTATTFASGQVVFYGGKQWIAKTATVAGDVPAVSSKWEEITFEALANKTVTVDQTIIDGSTNAVSGNAVFDGLALKSNIGHTHVASQITDLSKASVGLGNVDNTSDLSKPLSTATINALATKAPISSVHNPVTLGTANGLSLSTQQLSLGLASSGITGALSGTDWNTFNNKQPAITGLTTNFLPKWNGSGFGNSQIFDNGTNIGIGTTTPTAKFDVAGVIRSSFIDSYPSIEAFNQGTVGFPLFQLRNIKNSVEKFWNIENGRTVNGDLGFYNEGGQRVTFTTNGRVLINKTTDDLTNQLQVAGTITASPATTANQVVVKSQLDAAARPYKVYTALVTQIGTSAPTATVLENTLGGPISFSRVSAGIYRISLTGAFTVNKTGFSYTRGITSNALNVTNGIRRVDNDTIEFNSVVNGSFFDGQAVNDTIEIRVYN